MYDVQILILLMFFINVFVYLFIGELIVKGDKPPDNLFVIEHYPKTGRYYPKYKNFYLKRNHHTGIIEKREEFLFVYADYSDTAKGAEKIIDEFKEHYLKEGVNWIKYNSN